MAYQVLSLKWRPKTFNDVVGQAHVTDTLRNAFNKNRIAQAYLFTGPRGVGKTTTARILAAALNCLENQDGIPCNQCSNCREIAESRNMDVLEIDGASNRGIEEIRNLREMIKYTPINSPYKIFIIDEVHMLTGPAFNALLKTLEEPPQHGKFILATTDIHKVPPTIISRCQRYDFNRITVQIIADRLKIVLKDEKIEFDQDSVQAIARKADGSMRDGLSFLDQVIAYCGETIAYESAIKVLGIIPFDLHFNMSTAIREKSATNALTQINNIQSSGVPIIDFINGFSQHIRNLLYASLPDAEKILDAGEELRTRYIEDAAHWDKRDLLRIAHLLQELEKNIRRADQPYLMLEMLILKLLEMDTSVAIDEVLKSLSGQPVLPIKLRSKPEPPKPVEVKTKPSSEPASPTVPASPSKETESIKSKSEPINSPPQSTPIVELSIADMDSKWGGIVGDIYKNHTSIGNILEQSRIMKIQNNRVVIGISNASLFHMNLVEKKKNQIEEIFSRHVQRDITLQFEIINQVENTKDKQVSHPEDRPVIERERGADTQSEAVVERIIELFDGEQIR